MIGPDGNNPPPPSEHPDDLAHTDRFAVWSDAQSCVHGLFTSWQSAIEFWARLPAPKTAQVKRVPHPFAERLFLHPLKLLRELDASALPIPSKHTPYVDTIERWLWGNTHLRTNLIDYLNAVGDGDGPALDTTQELAIARRALKFAAKRLQAGIVQ